MFKRLPFSAPVALLSLVSVVSLPGEIATAQATSQDRSTSQDLSQFEVASVRPIVTDAISGEGGTRSQIQSAPDGLTLRNIDLDEMIEWAYTVQHNQLASVHLYQLRFVFHVDENRALPIRRPACSPPLARPQPAPC